VEIENRYLQGHKGWKQVPFCAKGNEGGELTTDRFRASVFCELVLCSPPVLAFSGIDN
jgi:hypothetical protein